MLDLLGSTSLTPVKITLTLEQMQWVVEVGLTKIKRMVEGGYQHKYGYKDEDGRLLISIEGFAGELAAAVALGIPWHGDPFNTGPDLGTRIEVRTRRRHHYDLLVRPSDPVGRIYILVTGVSPDFLVWGWVWGYEAKQPEFMQDLHNGRPAPYLVPHECPPMHPLSELEGMQL